MVIYSILTSQYELSAATTFDEKKKNNLSSSFIPKTHQIQCVKIEYHKKATKLHLLSNFLKSKGL